MATPEELKNQKRRTNNPNATPTATNNPVATVRTQAEVAADKQPDTAALLRTLVGGQGDLLQQVKTNKGTTRRTIGGAVVDPRAPTGLDWLEAYGPDREVVGQRQAALDAQLMTPEKIQAGRDAVSELRAQQEAAGLRSAFDNSEAFSPAGKTIQTPGSDVRVAYDNNGMPVGFSGATPTSPTGAPLPPVAGRDGGFSDAESAAFRKTASDLAANQAVNDYFQGAPKVEVGPLEPGAPPASTGSQRGEAIAGPGGTPWSVTARQMGTGLRNNNILDLIQAGVNTTGSAVGEAAAKLFGFNPNLPATAPTAPVVPSLDPTGEAWNTPEEVRAGLDRARRGSTATPTSSGAQSTPSGSSSVLPNWLQDVFRGLGYGATMAEGGGINPATWPKPIPAGPSLSDVDAERNMQLAFSLGGPTGAAITATPAPAPRPALPPITEADMSPQGMADYLAFRAAFGTEEPTVPVATTPQAVDPEVAAAFSVANWASRLAQRERFNTEGPRIPAPPVMKAGSTTTANDQALNNRLLFALLGPNPR